MPRNCFELEETDGQQAVTFSGAWKRGAQQDAGLSSFLFEMLILETVVKQWLIYPAQRRPRPYNGADQFLFYYRAQSPNKGFATYASSFQISQTVFSDLIVSDHDLAGASRSFVAVAVRHRLRQENSATGCWYHGQYQTG